MNAASRDEVIFTRGATEAINLVANTWGMKELKPGDEILLSVMEHHSNLVPWQLVAAKTGAQLKVRGRHFEGREGVGGLVGKDIRLLDELDGAGLLERHGPDSSLT